MTGYRCFLVTELDAMDSLKSQVFGRKFVVFLYLAMVVAVPGGMVLRNGGGIKVLLLFIAPFLMLAGKACLIWKHEGIENGTRFFFLVAKVIGGIAGAAFVVDLVSNLWSADSWEGTVVISWLVVGVITFLMERDKNTKEFFERMQVGERLMEIEDN